MARRRNLLVIPVLAAALVAGCGGSSSTPAATTGGGGATSAPATPAAPATDAGGGSGASPAAGGINLGAAASALDNLNNYTFVITMSSKGTSDFVGVPQGGSMSIEGSVIFKPEPQAADITMTTTGGSSGGAMKIRIIGDMSYVNLGGDQWMASQDSSNQSTIDAYKPESLLGSYASMSGLNKVGEETKNGVPCDHFQSTEDSGYASMFGLPEGTWQMDVWTAKDGGYVISTLSTATAKAGAETGQFSMGVDITKVNDNSLKIEKPDNVMEIPS